LAGGLNLYGFANGDPVNMRDPFGLSADTLQFADKELAEKGMKCAAESAVCGEIYQALHADPRTIRVVRGELQAPNAGRYEVFGTGPLNIQGATITLDLDNLPATSEYVGIPFDFNVALVHEMGHVLGNFVYSKLGWLSNTVSCDEPCARSAENAYRAAQQMPLRSLTGR
jgi:hypothetical protein